MLPTARRVLVALSDRPSFLAYGHLSYPVAAVTYDAREKFLSVIDA